MLSLSNVRCEIYKTPILNGVSFSVKEGETVGIIGPNGSGKTTLFNCISGFNAVREGGIEFKGESLCGLSASAIARRGIGRVFQNFGIFREMTVCDNIVAALESRQPLHKTFFPWGKTTRENREKALEFLKEVGLESKAKAKAGSLSGGQMRLLEIVRTLAFGANLFLLDEPTAGVSPKMKNDVARLIVKLKEMNKSILIIEHDIGFIQQFCDRIVVLDIGQVVLDDTPEKVKGSEMLREIYFG